MLAKKTFSLFFVSSALTLLSHCSSHDRAEEPVKAKKHSDVKVASTSEVAPPPPAEPAQLQNTQAPSPLNSPLKTSDGKVLPVLEDCESNGPLKDEFPVFLPDTKVMVTRIMSPCQDKTGNKGHKKNASWMSMGFPCTGGEGRIDWKGTNYSRPKMVTFLLETSCPIAPQDHNKIKQEAERVLGIKTAAPMIAVNPFVIQYWEIPESGDADTSFTVDIRSAKGLDDSWTKFLKPSPLKVFLVGRENAWVSGNFLYAVEGELHLASKNRFTLKVSAARVLQGEELKQVKSRCEQLKPERECGRVF